MWFILFSILALVIPALASWVYQWRNPKYRGRLPPGSTGFPVIGETLEFFVPSKSLDIPPFLQKRIQRYGTMFKTHLVGRPVIVSSDPDFNNFIFQQEGKSVQLWYMDSFSKLLGIGDDLTGYAHKYLKKVVSEHFGLEKLKERILSELEAVADRTLSSWTKEESVEMKRACSTMILNYTSRQLFGYDPVKAEENLSDLYFNLIKGVMSVPLNVPGTAFHKCLQKQKRIMKTMRDTVEERRNDSPETRKKRYDFLDHLIEEMKFQSFLTYDFISYVMFALTFATMETIPATLTLAIKLINDHPLVLQELLKEHEEIMKKKEDANCGLAWEDYKLMTFTMHVINESLRMASVAAGILRKTTKDVHVNGYTIPEGWTIMVVPCAIHLNPETYKNPLEFNPWRWEELGPNIKGRNFIPFGGGLRSCAGAEFSKVLMVVFLHVLLTKYKWNTVKESNITRAPVLNFGDGYYINVSKKVE